METMRWWWQLVMTIGNCGKLVGWFPTLLSPPASCQLCKLYHHDLDWSIIQNKHYHSNKHCHHPSSITQEIVIFCKRVKSGGRVFIMKSWWKELRPKGSLYCAGPNIDHMWLGAPPQPPSTSFDQRQRLRSSLSDRQHPRNTRNCQKLVEIVAREASHVLWPVVVYWRRGGIIFIEEQPSHKQSIWRLWSWLDKITLKAPDDSQSICISFKTSIYTVS